MAKMALSTLRKYKLITGEDLMKSTNNLKKIVSDDNLESYTDTAEPIFYGLSLAYNMVDLNEAKRRYNESKTTHDLGEYVFTTERLSDLIKKAF